MELDSELIPRYRGSGIHYILEWNTHNKGSHIVLTKTEQSIIKTGLIIFDKIKPDFRSYWVGDIVLPPEALRDDWRGKQYQIALYNFKTNIITDVVLHYKETGLIPKQFKPCLNILNDDSLYHSCTTCKDNPVRYDGSWEELYESKLGKTTVISIADSGKSSNPNQTLFGVILDSGYHCKGVIIKPIFNIDDMPGWHTKPLFFFHGEQKQIPAQLLTAKETYNERIRIKNEATQLRIAANHAADIVKMTAELEELFGPLERK